MQTSGNSVLEKYGINNCCFKLLDAANDIKNFSKNSHCHSSFEIHIINSGYQIYEADGKEYKVESGHMLIVPPRLTHRFKSLGENTSKFGITFNLDESLYHFIKDKCISTEITSVIQNNLQEIFSEYRNNLFFSQQLLENSIFNIIVHILRIMKYKETRVTKSVIGEDSRLLMAKQYINDNISKSLKVSDVAAYCYLSAKQLTRLFRDVDDITPAEYIRNTKVKCAETLINQGNSFADISEMLGFSNQYHFNSFFTKYTGITPGVYRKMFR